MKKIWLFFSGLFSLSLGLGFFSSVSREAKVSNKVKNTVTNTISLKPGETCILGSFPQSIANDVTADEIIQNGEKQIVFGVEYYLYHEKKYTILPYSEIDLEGSSDSKLSNGHPVEEYLSASNIVIEFKDLEWEYLKEGEGEYIYLITSTIIDREVYHSSDGSFFYLDSFIYDYLNARFKEIAFSETDCTYIYGYKNSKEDFNVNLPSKNDVDPSVFNDINLNQASDYAILKNLTSHVQVGTDIPYLNAGYWLADQVGDRVSVHWTNGVYTSCLKTDPKIGVRPVIAVNSAKGQQGGSTTDPSKPDPSDPTEPSKPTSASAGNVTLPLGIVFTIIGASGLIVFFVLWGKKDPKGKPPVWILASLAGSFLVTVVGFITLPIGILGGGGGVVVGWYQGNMYDCVGFGERLAINLTKDGRVFRYVADAWEGSAVNYTFHRQAGVGSYSFEGGKLTIVAAPEWHLSSWELPTMVYTDVHGLGSFIKYDGYVGTKYQWYHYSRVDSQGIESITNANTHEGGEINKW